MGHLDRKKQQQQIEKANQKAQRPDPALQIAAKAGGMALRPIYTTTCTGHMEEMAKRIRRGDNLSADNSALAWDLTTDRKRTDRDR